MSVARLDCYKTVVMSVHSEVAVFLSRMELFDDQKTGLGVLVLAKSGAKRLRSVVLLGNVVRVVIWDQNVR